MRLTFFEHFRKKPLQNSLIALILFIHLLFVLILIISPTFLLDKKRQHKPLIVKTLTHTPKLQAKAVAPTLPKPKAAPLPPVRETKKVEPVAKKEMAPAAAIKPAVKQSPPVKKEPAISDKVKAKQNTSQVAQKKAPPPPPPRAKISDSLLQELEESIAKIEHKGNPSKVANSKKIAPIALQIDRVQIEEEETEESTNDYAESLVNHLHRLLSLPDYGEVKIQLSLHQDGTVAKLIVLKAQSEKNKQYLQAHLPHLKFPRFEGAYASKAEHTFVLNFCNEL